MALSEQVIFQYLLIQNKILKVNSFKNRQVRIIFKKRASDFAYSSRDSRVLGLLETRKAQRNFTKIHENFWVRTKHGNLCKFPETFIPKVENSSGNLPKWAKIARNYTYMSKPCETLPCPSDFHDTHLTLLLFHFNCAPYMVF